VDNEPYVIEYNCRMGDPETEVVMPRLKNDLIELLQAAANQKLDEVLIEVDGRAACTVVAASGGYPGDYKKGLEIKGLAEATGTVSTVYHAGTIEKNGAVLTNGGRVLCVTSFGDTITDTVKNSLHTLEKISFEGMFYRKDIGYEFQ
jgi:phosphoribosylamine--glycine ligase